MAGQWTKSVVNTSFRHGKVIIVVIVALTLLATLPLKALHFDPAYDRFTQDRDETGKKIERYFGPSGGREIIYFKSKVGNVLDTRCIREMHETLRRVKGVEGVESVVSISEIINVIYSYDPSTGAVNDSRDITTAEDYEISTTLNLLFSYLNGSIQLPMNLSLGPYYDQAYIKNAIETLLSVDLSYNPPMARAAVAVVFTKRGLDNEALISTAERISALVKGEQLEYLTAETTGMGEIYGAVKENAVSEFIILSALSVCAMALILLLAFGRMQAVVMPFAVITLALIWTFSTASMLSMPLTTLSIIIVPVTFGLGIDYSIHMQRFLLTARRDAWAIKRDMATVAVAVFGAMATTVIGFLSNVTSDIAALVDLSILMALAIALSYLFALTLIPAATTLILNRSRPNRINKHTGYIKVTRLTLLRLTRWVRKKPHIVLFIIVLLVLPSLYIAPQTRTEFRTEDFLPPEWPALRTRNTVVDEFNGAEYITVSYLIEGNMYNPEVFAVINDILTLSADNTGAPGLNRTPLSEHLGIYMGVLLYSNATLRARCDINNDFIPDTNEAMEEIMSNLSALAIGIKDPLSGEPLVSKMAAIVHINNAISGSGATIVRVFFEVSDTDTAVKLRNDVNSDLGVLRGRHGNYSINVHAFTFQVLKTIQAIRDTELNSMLFALPWIFLILIVIFRSPTLALITLIPVALVILFVLATMSLAHIAFNVLSVSIIALSFGLGVDYSIYIIRELKGIAEVRKRMSIEGVLAHTYLRTGPSIYLSALTTAVGFGILTLSNIPIVQNYGILTAIMILYSLVIALVLTPILAGLWLWHKGRKWGQDAVVGKER